MLEHRVPDDALHVENGGGPVAEAGRAVEAVQEQLGAEPGDHLQRHQLDQLGARTGEPEKLKPAE